MIKRERGREIFHWLVQSPDGHSSQLWTRLKPGGPIWSPVWVVVARTLGPSSATFPGCINSELDPMWSSWDSNWHSDVICCGGLVYCNQYSSPLPLFDLMTEGSREPGLPTSPLGPNFRLYHSPFSCSAGNLPGAELSPEQWLSQS